MSETSRNLPIQESGHVPDGLLEAGPVRPGEYFSRVALTPAALQLVNELWAENGPLMFHQSGGCCDGSAPMCFPEGDYLTGPADVQIGIFDLGGGRHLGFWMSAEQFSYWSHTHLTVDVVTGRGSGFSLESPRGVRFLIRSTLMETWPLEA